MTENNEEFDSEEHSSTTCPKCGHDWRGDGDEFVSGGGLVVEHTITDGVFVQEMQCPQCRTVIDASEQEGLR